MHTSVRIANIVDEICRRQDHVLQELDQLDQRLEQVLRSLNPQAELVPVPVVVPAERKAA